MDEVLFIMLFRANCHLQTEVDTMFKTLSHPATVILQTLVEAAEWFCFKKTTAATLYDVSKLVLSPIVTRPAAQQQHRVWVVGGGPTHYVVFPNSCWGWVGAVTIKLLQLHMDVRKHHRCIGIKSKSTCFCKLLISIPSESSRLLWFFFKCQ